MSDKPVILVETASIPADTVFLCPPVPVEDVRLRSEIVDGRVVFFAEAAFRMPEPRLCGIIRGIGR